MGVKTDGCSYAEEWDVIVFHFFVQSPNGDAEQFSQLFDGESFLFGPQLLNQSHFWQVSPGTVLGLSSPSGNRDVNQFDSFLPPCPITFRIEFIPAGY
jgi:hypothetical protein